MLDSVYLNNLYNSWSNSLFTLKNLRNEYTINGHKFYSPRIPALSEYLFKLMYSASDYYIYSNYQYKPDVVCHEEYNDNNLYTIILLYNGLSGIEDFKSNIVISLPDKNDLIDLFGSFKKENYDYIIDESLFLITESVIKTSTFKSVSDIDEQIKDKFQNIVFEIGGV